MGESRNPDTLDMGEVAESQRRRSETPATPMAFSQDEDPCWQLLVILWSLGLPWASPLFLMLMQVAVEGSFQAPVHSKVASSPCRHARKVSAVLQSRAQPWLHWWAAAIPPEMDTKKPISTAGKGIPLPAAPWASVVLKPIHGNLKLLFKCRLSFILKQIGIWNLPQQESLCYTRGFILAGVSYYSGPKSDCKCRLLLLNYRSFHLLHFWSPTCVVTLQISPPQCIAFWRDLNFSAYLSELIHRFIRLD